MSRIHCFISSCLFFLLMFSTVSFGLATLNISINSFKEIGKAALGINKKTCSFLEERINPCFNSTKLVFSY